MDILYDKSLLILLLSSTLWDCLIKCICLIRSFLHKLRLYANLPFGKLLTTLVYDD
jgi:hypothetical protein